MSGKKHCISCNKSGGILTCDGCQQTFCGKHVMEHRQQLANQLDGIMQDHESIRQDLERPSNQHSLLQMIDKWENESITKIQVAAEDARADLRQILDSSKERLFKVCGDVATNLRSAREADDFSEIDLDRWMKQLNELKLEMKSPSTIKIAEDKHAALHFIRIERNDCGNKASVKSDESFFSKKLLPFNSQERFAEIQGPAAIDDSGLRVQCVGDGFSYAYIRGKQLYYQGRHTVRFRIEQSRTPYDIFFGCISSQGVLEHMGQNSPFVAGWFGRDRVYQCGVLEENSSKHGYRSKDIRTDDVLQLILDCQERQIELFHEQTNKRHTIYVNLNKMPFPWQIMVAFHWINDCVRILPNT